MKRPNLSVVLGAAATAVQVGSAKEPPQRNNANLETAFISVTRTRAFDYNWKERLEAIRPSSHPLMPFTQYRQYQDQLYTAVRILNETVKVDFSTTIDDVRNAFDRLRAARHDGNLFLRQTNRGMTDYQMRGEDLSALLDLTTIAAKDSSLQKALGHQWLREQKQRDNVRDGWQLRVDLQNGLNATLPSSYAEELYKRAIFHFQEKDALSARIETSGIKLV